MLGRDLVEQLTEAGAEVTGLPRQSLDITNAAAIAETLSVQQPDVVINAAAYTRVDDAEQHEPDASAVNAIAPGHLARWCASNGARMIHLSTDYVFPGDATTPYDTDAATGPTSAYGRTKVAGERAVLDAGGDGHVVRTGWLYGAHGPSFVRTVGGRLRDGEQVQVVTDQRGAPTCTVDLARRLIALGTAQVAPAVWHCTAGGEVTWFDVAVALCDLLGADPAQVRPTTSAAMQRPAPRPAYSVLSNRRWVGAGLPPMPSWRDALADAIATTPDLLRRDKEGG
jgi:dTDP-4-dehydrorhamnose reductase